MTGEDKGMGKKSNQEGRASGKTGSTGERQGMAGLAILFTRDQMVTSLRASWTRKKNLNVEFYEPFLFPALFYHPTSKPTFTSCYSWCGMDRI